MKYFLEIPLLGVLTYLTICASAHTKNGSKSQRSKRSFGFSNPIFSRVFNPYDDRPLVEKFFGDDYAPAPPQRDGPQYYPLWYSQPVMDDEDYVEEYPRRHGYTPLSWRFGNHHTETNGPYPPATKPYPEASKPYTAPSKPYPAPSKPYPAPSKPYPAPTTPCPKPTAPSPSKPYPEANKPYPGPSKPYPAPSKPYPAPSKPHPEAGKPHQSSWKPVIANLFVDEVDKTLHFEKDPVTGQLVPVITSGSGTRDRHRNENFETEYSHPTTTTVRYENQEEYQFKQLPHYDIQTKFNKPIPCSTTPKSTTSKPVPTEPTINFESFEEKFRILEQEEKKREKERIQWKLERQNNFEEAKNKILRDVFGDDVSKWPSRFTEAASRVNKKPEEDTKSQETTTVRIENQNTFKSLPRFDIRRKFVEEPKVSKLSQPIIILPHQQNSQEVSVKVPCKHRNHQKKKPCPVKTSHGDDKNSFLQLLVNTDKPSETNVQTYQQTETKPTSFYEVIVPHSTISTADYSQFLAPPSSIIYQKFKKLPTPVGRLSTTSTSPVYPAPSRKVQITLQPSGGPSIRFEPTLQKVQPSRGLQFRVFKNKLDQSVLDSLKRDQNGDIDTSKLDELTETVFVEPLNRNDPNVRKVLQTLDSAGKNFDFLVNQEQETPVPASTYGLPSSVLGLTEFSLVFDDAKRRNKQDYSGVGDIPLDKHNIWDNADRTLKDSYGEETATK